MQMAKIAKFSFKFSHCRRDKQTLRKLTTEDASEVSAYHTCIGVPRSLSPLQGYHCVCVACVCMWCGGGYVVWWWVCGVVVSVGGCWCVCGVVVCMWDGGVYVGWWCVCAVVVCMQSHLLHSTHFSQNLASLAALAHTCVCEWCVH